MTISNKLPSRTLKSRRAALSVGFILAPRFTLSAFANFVDVLRLAADEGDRSRPILCSWSVLSDDLGAAKSSCGVTVQPQERLGDPRKFDYVVVIGGLIGGDEALDPAYVKYLRQAARLGVPLGGVCTGTFALHAAGLMQGYRCCVSWFHYDDFRARFDDMEPVANQIFVIDRDRLTCAGGASSAHLAAYLVEKHIGARQAQKGLNIMIIDAPLGGEVPQPHLDEEPRVVDPLVRRAMLLMRQHMPAPLPAGDLARALQTGRRNLERRFLAVTGTGPSQACRDLRLLHASRLLQETGRAVGQIALDCGFSDASHLTRHFRRRFDYTPAAWRQKHAPHGVSRHPAGKADARLAR